jgi:hypothetical protein
MQCPIPGDGTRTGAGCSDAWRCQKFSFRLEKVRFCAPDAEMARGLETFLAALAVGLLACSPASADPLLRQFSLCAGRLSAVMEHQWLIDGPASETTARQRDAMLALVEALLTPEEAPRAMQWRIEAKVAQAALLNRASFAKDPVAEARAEDLMQQCLALMGQS